MKRFVFAGGEFAATVQDTSGELRVDKRRSQWQNQIRTLRTHRSARQLPGIVEPKHIRSISANVIHLLRAKQHEHHLKHKHENPSK